MNDQPADKPETQSEGGSRDSYVHPEKGRPGRPRRKLPAPGSPENGEAQRFSRGNQVFGSKIKLLREARGISQRQLSNFFKNDMKRLINETTIGRMERGLQSPINMEILAYRDYFNADLEWLVNDAMSAEDYQVGNSGLYALAYQLVRNLTPAEAIYRLQNAGVESVGSANSMRPVDPQSEIKPKGKRSGGKSA